MSWRLLGDMIWFAAALDVIASRLDLITARSVIFWTVGGGLLGALFYMKKHRPKQ